MTTALSFSAGELVRARGREWIVLSSGDALRLRPLSGSEQDVETLIPELEIEPVSPATFDPPTGERPGPREAAVLLRDALRLSLRRGAGPFRSAGRINFEPRAYQLAPLMMALRQETVRLLIADDVGVGKTIEAALILREFLDRGDIDRFAVLCPPHLVEQWTAELESKFALSATPVTASEAARLERDLPTSMSVFEAYPFTVVSLDFIKSERRLDDFLRACPDMVVVDEAHAAVSGGRGRHRRFDLLRKLAERADRHLVMLTATPHSGDEEAFHNLLGLLAPEFGGLREAAGDEYRTLREKLAGHFIQRRRADIEAWREPGLFPIRETTEQRYTLSGTVERFYGDVVDYCAEVVEAQQGERGRRLAFWGTLALMRCVGSSPAAAARALRTRAVLEEEDAAEAERIAATTLDDEDLAEDDVEPGAAIEDPRLAALVATADALAATMPRDPKFMALKRVLDALIADGFSPVVFCRYIATAEAVGAALAKAFRTHTVETVTGALPGEEREARVLALGEEERRILVATDCLSEGVNLQSAFDAVVHYDLSWNPTRHQQREGRVDRFGQKNEKVRTVLLYGENNPVDGAVLDVILRKATAIEKQTGVRVPMPDDGGSLTRALMAAVLLRARERRQMSLDFGVADTDAARQIDVAWTNASEREKKARTVFAQRTLKPDEVIPEWEATRKALGGFEDAERFVGRSMMRLGAGLVALPRGHAASLDLVPERLKERFQAEGLLDDSAQPKPLRIAFEARPAAGYLSIHRAHPLPGILAESFLENALDPQAPADDPATLPRCGVWETDGVDRVTTLLLLRIRHRIDSKGRLGPRFAMAEEAGAIAVTGKAMERVADGDAAFALLEAASANVVEAVRTAQIARAVAALPALRPALDALAGERAAALAEDHQRVRQALGSRAAVKVEAVTPVDVIGLYVLMPRL